MYTIGKRLLKVFYTDRYSLRIRKGAKGKHEQSGFTVQYRSHSTESQHKTVQIQYVFRALFNKLRQLNSYI